MVSCKCLRFIVLAVVLLAFFAPFAIAGDGEAEEKKEPTPREQIMGMEEMCAANAEAIKARQAEKSLYERVGGEEKINAMITELVRVHEGNDTMTRFMEGVDPDHFIATVTEFLVVATGGPGEYSGRNMVDAHAHLKITNEDFLAAGADFKQAMDNVEIGENEQQELICAFVSLRPAVVVESDKSLQ